MRTNIMMHSQYIGTVDEDGHKHNYRVTPWEAARHSWKGETIVTMHSPTFKFADIISDEAARNLWAAVK